MSINTRNKISAALGFARTFAAALAACAVISSCEIFHADNPSQIGSITMRLPSAEQMSAASGGAISGAVTSYGILGDSSVAAFKVRAKNAVTGLETSQITQPGSIIKISPLEPGFWNVTVFGNNSGGQTIYYGNSANILVAAGKTTPASVVINPVNSSTPLVATLAETPAGVSLQGQGRENVMGVYVSYSSGGQNGSAYYDFSNAAGSAKQGDDLNKITVPIPAFLEPGSAVSGKVYLFDRGGTALWGGSIEGSVMKDGTFDCAFAFLETALKGYQGSPARTFLKVEEALPAQLETPLAYTFETMVYGAPAGESKSYSDLTIFSAAPSEACGKIPVIVECGSSAWAGVFDAKHKYAEPTVTMPEQKIPLGATRTLSAVVSSSEQKEYSVFKAAQDYDARGFKLYSIQDKDTGSTVSASSYAAPANPVSSEFTEPDKVKATGSGSDEYTWQVTVTNSAYSYFDGDETQPSKTFNGSFNVTASEWTITPASVTVERGAAFALTLSCADATEADAKSVTTVTLKMNTPKDFVPTVSGTSLVVNAESFATWTSADPKKVFVYVESVDAGMIEVTATAPSGGGGGMNYPPDPDWFSFQSTPEVLPEGTQGAAEVIYNNVNTGSRLLYPAPTPRYVKFGNYPRTHKAASVNIDESVYQTMGNFTYYKGDDNNWYAKFQVKKNSSTTYYNNGTDTIEATSNYAYFKLEPITWRVLTTNYKGTGKALLVTDEALPGYFDYANSPGHKAFAFVYNSDYSTPNRNIGGKTIYKNNYQYSNARAWLNGLDGSGYGQQDWTNAGFINSAFTEAGRMKIAETDVDNSAQSCYQTFEVAGTTYNNYLSDNTTDKVFILSSNEITNPLYGFYEPSNQYNSRCYIPTDLALASNAQVTYNPTTIACCYCYLRSPYTSDTGLQSCGQDGAIGSGAASVYDDYSNYFAPAICVDLSSTVDAQIGKVGEGNAAADNSHGLLPGKFTVNASGKQVKFSQSNLWKNISTSTEYHFVSQQYYYSERNTSRDSTDYFKYNHDLFDYLDETAISSITIPESDITNWRLLTADEWQYLFEGRTNAASKFGVAKIYNFDYTGGKSVFMTGFVLLPDNWDNPPSGLTFTPGWSSTDLPDITVNKYDSWEWKKMEEAGAVFLPAGGSCRKDGSWTYVYSWTSKYRGLYWNAEHKLVNMAKNQIQSNTNPDYDPYFASIRLVVDAN